MEAGQTHYVDVPGIGPLREKIAAYLNESTGSACQSGNIIVTAGLQESRFLTIQKIGELYESIAVPEVVHPGARKALGVRQRQIVSLPVDAEGRYLPTLAGLAAVVRGGLPPALSGIALAIDRRRLFRRGSR